MLDTDLSARVEDGDVALTLTVVNRSENPVTLRFRTGQRAEFTASDLDGAADPERVSWRYGEGQLFTQALGEERLTPGTSTTYEADWRDAPPGSYRIVGEVVGSAVGGDVDSECVGDVDPERAEVDEGSSPPTAEATVRVE